MDDVVKWFGCRDTDEYLDLLELEGPRIFERATY